MGISRTSDADHSAVAAVPVMSAWMGRRAPLQGCLGRRIVNARTKQIVVTATVLLAIGASAAGAAAQDQDELRAITARVHGTFQDTAGGLGVVSGDMTI